MNKISERIVVEMVQIKSFSLNSIFGKLVHRIVVVSNAFGKRIFGVWKDFSVPTEIVGLKELCPKRRFRHLVRHEFEVLLLN